MVKTRPSRPPGRPKNEGKRNAIIDAARRLFVAHTYESVTMDEVASAAGVAKMTVYGHFHDKASLFEAMVQSTTDMMAAAVPTELRDDGGLEKELVVFGEAFLTVLFSPGVVSSFHSHFEMLSRNRVLAQRFFDAGPGLTRARLAAYLSATAGWMDHPPEYSIHAASDLMNLWIGDRPQRVAMGLAEPITVDQIAQHVSRCTRIFLRGYGLLSADQHDGVQFREKRTTKMKATHTAPGSRRKQPPNER